MAAVHHLRRPPCTTGNGTNAPSSAERVHHGAGIIAPWPAECLHHQAGVRIPSHRCHPEQAKRAEGSVSSCGAFEPHRFCGQITDSSTSPLRRLAQNDTEGIYSYRKRKPSNCAINSCKMGKKAVYSTMVNLEKRGFSYVYSRKGYPGCL